MSLKRVSEEVPLGYESTTEAVRPGAVETEQRHRLCAVRKTESRHVFITFSQPCVLDRRL